MTYSVNVFNANNTRKIMKPTVALIIGTDLTAHILANGLAERLSKLQVRCVIYLTSGPVVKAGQLVELKRLMFLERQLLQSVVFPFLEELPLDIDARCTVPAHFAEKFGELLTVQVVPDVNSDVFLAQLKSAEMDIAISIRCYQKFGQKLLKFFEPKTKLLLNLHPGILPFYRGVFTYLRAMHAHDVIAGFTLHEMNEKWDAGPIYAVNSAPLDFRISALSNMISHHQLGQELVISLVEEWHKQSNISFVPQVPEQARYFSFPSANDLAVFREENLVLASADETIQWLLNLYASPTTTELLTRLLLASVIDFDCKLDCE